MGTGQLIREKGDGHRSEWKDRIDRFKKSCNGRRNRTVRDDTENKYTASRGGVCAGSRFPERYSYFDQMDVIISATASPHYTITKQRFSEHIRTKKAKGSCPIFAVPDGFGKKYQRYGWCSVL